MPLSTLDTKIVPVRTRDGVIVRVEATNLGGPEKTGILDAIPFDEVSRAVEGIASAVADTVVRLKPQKATIELGIEVGWEAGKLVAVLCQGTAKANLKITLEWTKPSS